MVSSRCLYHCYYHLKDDFEVEEIWGEGKIPEDEKERFAKGFTYLVSTLGNDMYAEMFAESHTQKDVVATLFFDYIKIRPAYDAEGKERPGVTTVTQCISSDTGGWLPDMVQKLVAKDCAYSMK
jgi:hypothetical protein